MTDTLNGRAVTNLFAEIKRRRMTQEEFAELAGVSRVTLSRILNGHTVLDLDRLEVFARLLELEPSKLLND